MDQPGKLITVGAVTGVFSGLTGVGGGPVLVSLMASTLGMGQRDSQGTAPAVILPVAVFGAITYIAQGIGGRFFFDTALAASVIPAVALPSIAGVLIGVTWMSDLPATQLRRAFGVFAFLIALSMLAKDVLPVSPGAGAAVAVPLIFWVLLGFVVGVFAGFLGVGGGILIVPFMTLGAGMEQHMSQSITLAVVAITTVVGAVAQYRHGNVSLPVVRAMTPVAVAAAIVGSLVAGQIPGFWLTKVFALALLYFGYQFTFGAPRPAATRATSVDPSAGFYRI